MANASQLSTQWINQLRDSHECSKLFVLHVFLVCIVSFQITKPRNVEWTKYTIEHASESQQLSALDH